MTLGRGYTNGRILFAFIHIQDWNQYESKCVIESAPNLLFLKGWLRMPRFYSILKKSSKKDLVSVAQPHPNLPYRALTYIHFWIALICREFFPLRENVSELWLIWFDLKKYLGHWHNQLSQSIIVSIHHIPENGQFLLAWLKVEVQLNTLQWGFIFSCVSTYKPLML